MQQAFVIPVYKHGSTLKAVIDSLRQYELPVIVVDDGNDSANKELINAVCSSYSKSILVVNKKNKGKGGAVCEAVKEAHKRGITHIFQIDADGQHDAGRCKTFLDASVNNPESLICGYPEYDESVPAKRKNGREISNNYVRFVTLTSKKEVVDTMCGYRIYPVEKFYKIIKTSFIDRYMGFDSEILVRMIWKKTPVINLPVKVTYPAGGTSNFRMIRDNVHISFMFARMTIGMLLRLPVLVCRKIRRK